MQPHPSTEDRIWAALSHLSALAPGMGLILPIIGWSEQRRKSKYAAFQCLQALGYQSLGYTVWILLFLVISIIDSILLLANQEETIGGDASFTSWMAAHGLLLFILFGSYFLPPIVAAVLCAFGRDFHYPLMGTRLARYLKPEIESDWLHDDHADRWVAAMGHFSVIIALCGMLAPVSAWIMQGQRSPWLKFQSIQTVVFQALVLLLTLGAGAVYMVGLVAFAVLFGFGGNAGIDSSTSLVGLAGIVIVMLMAALMILVIPLFHILGQWAGYRLLKGNDYFYPVIGRLVKGRLS